MVVTHLLARVRTFISETRRGSPSDASTAAQQAATRGEPEPPLALHRDCPVESQCCEQCFKPTDTKRVKTLGGDVYALCDSCRESVEPTFDVEADYPPTFE